MPCTSPRTVGFKADGKTISWSQKEYSKEFASFQLPCGKCLECRLAYAREWAIRCVHEASTYEKNIFLTLTYDDDHLASPRLIYSDVQNFIKKLRKRPYSKDGQFVHQQEDPEPMGFFITGEYGGPPKTLPNGTLSQGFRPHWHIIVFNYEPNDGVLLYTHASGDRVQTSATIDRIWGKGNAEYGPVNKDTAGYCARYAAKKLVHGKDDDHDFHPISKKSSKYAIGKRWLEQNWKDIFLQGHLLLDDGNKVPIPRYYEKWLKTHRPADWLCYIQKIKLGRLAEAESKSQSESEYWWEQYNRRDPRASTPLTRNQVRRLISEKKFTELQAYLKF